MLFQDRGYDTTVHIKVLQLILLTACLYTCSLVKNGKFEFKSITGLFIRPGMICVT